MAEDFDSSTPCWPLGQPDPSRLNETWEETFSVSPCTVADRRFARLLAIPRASSPQVRQPSSVLAFHPPPTTHHPPRPPPPPPPPTALTPVVSLVVIRLLRRPIRRRSPLLHHHQVQAILRSLLSQWRKSAFHLCLSPPDHVGIPLVQAPMWARFVLCVSGSPCAFASLV